MDTQTSIQAPSRLTQRFAAIAADPEQVRHLHRVLGPYCHESRNLLNVLKLSLYLSRKDRADGARSGVLERIGASYEELERVIDRLHQLCRPLPFRAVRLPIHLLCDERRPAWEATLGRSGRRLELLRPDSPVVGGFDPGRLGEALDDLVAWRASLGPSEPPVVMTWGQAEGMLRFECNDAATGRPRSRVGDLLAVPLVVRAAALHGGFVETEDTDRGWRLRLFWPPDVPNPP